jgi:hypothetical protein
MQLARKPCAWVLNLDADLELGAGPGWSPKSSVRAAMAPHVARLAAMLLERGDTLVSDRTIRGEARGRRGRAFCPTNRAIAALRLAGAEPDPHPSHEVLRTVNSRAFCAAMGPTLPGARFALALEEAIEAMRQEPPVGRGWRIKRAFGMAGRGQQRVFAGELSAPIRSSLAAAIASDGGVMLEPDVAIERELGVHGYVTASREVHLGRVVAQRCDAHGQWLSTEIAEDLPLAIHDALVAEAERVAARLSAAGYFGPFGIDAFTYRDGDGTLRLQPRSEINARYSMGFPIGFGRSEP